MATHPYDGEITALPVINSPSYAGRIATMKAIVDLLSSAEAAELSAS